MLRGWLVRKGQKRGSERGPLHVLSALQPPTSSPRGFCGCTAGSSPHWPPWEPALATHTLCWVRVWANFIYIVFSGLVLQSKKWVSVLWKLGLRCWILHSSIAASYRHVSEMVFSWAAWIITRWCLQEREVRLVTLSSDNYFPKMVKEIWVSLRYFWLCGLHREDSFACVSKTPGAKGNTMPLCKGHYFPLNILMKENKQYFPGSNSLTVSHSALAWEGNHHKVSPGVPEGCLCPFSYEGTQGRGCQRPLPILGHPHVEGTCFLCTRGLEETVWLFSYPPHRLNILVFPIYAEISHIRAWMLQLWWRNPAMSLVTLSLPRQDRKEVNVWCEKQQHP